MRISDGVDCLHRVELLDATSSTDRLLAGTRIGPLAFPGIVPVYGTQLYDRRGRQKISVSWGEQAIDGIKHDSAELVRAALRHNFSNPEERLEAAGQAGAPFSFANAAVFTQEQMDRVVNDLKVCTRKINAETKRFVSDSEWLVIDQALGETGTYASVFMSRATGGDTGLHIAVALGRLRAAQVFVEEGCDATIVNDEGVCAVSILSDNFAKVMELVLRIAQLEEENSRKSVTGRRLTAEQKACLAQQERVANKANEYRLFGHGLACYFVDRLSNWRNLQEEERACEIEGREMDPCAERELRLCEVMRRYLGQCEAIRDREHATLPPLTAAQLESKAERFTGVFTPQRRKDRRRHRRHGDGTDGGESQPRAAPTVGANASLATRMNLCRTATPSKSDDDDDSDDGDDSFALEASADLPLGNNNTINNNNNNNSSITTSSTKFLANATLVSSLSSAASRGSGAKGLTARIAAAQNQQASSNIPATVTTTTGNNNNNTSSPWDNPHAGGATAAANTSSNESTSTPPPFQGRSLMSAEWISKRGRAGAARRRGQPRYATKGLTPGSWTATKDPISEGGIGVTAGQRVGGSGGSGGSAGLASGTGYFASQQGSGGAGASDMTRGERVTKRGLGRGWEGMYQVRPFEDTPDEG